MSRLFFASHDLIPGVVERKLRAVDVREVINSERAISSYSATADLVQQVPAREVRMVA